MSSLDSLAVIVLAAGKGTRMKSRVPKVLHKVCGMPMLKHILQAVEKLDPSKILVVIGYGAEEIRETISCNRLKIEWVKQDKQMGTGHALMCCKDYLQDFRGEALIVCGDTPLLDEETLKEFRTKSNLAGSQFSIMTTILQDPACYGRIIRGSDGKVRAIREASDASADELKIQEINTGNYLIKVDLLNQLLPRLDNQNSQKEYYLTDLIGLAVADGKNVYPVLTENRYSVIGVNDRVDLAVVSEIMKQRINKYWMHAGVTLIDPNTTYIDQTITKIGNDTLIYPGTMIKGSTVIGQGCEIGPNCVITDSNIGDHVIIKAGCVIEEAVIGPGSQVGPFAHLRPGAKLSESVKVGNFVEIKKSILGKGTKASHLTYIGDAQIGSGVNMGAGTITCNYDGYQKHVTEIGDNAFIGSNTALVAPIKVGKNAVVGAGSTLTKTVQDNALAVTRANQKTIPGYRQRLDERYKEKE